MSIQYRPISDLWYFFQGSTAQSYQSDQLSLSNSYFHQIQVSTSGTTAQSFTVYTSNDGNIYTPIFDESSTALQGDYNTNLTGVINLVGVYPWLMMESGTASSDLFTASIFSTADHKY